MKENIFPSYQGGSLIDTLDNLDLKNPFSNGPLRIPIIDRYKIRGNITVLGKIESGTLKKGKVVIMPNKIQAEVIKIKLHYIEVELAKAGENVALTLKTFSSIGDNDVVAGHVVCDADNILNPIEEFIGQFMVLEHKPIFSCGYKSNLHVHTSVVPCTITEFISELDKKTGKKLPKKVIYAQSNGLYVAKMKTDSPICAEKFDVLQQLGRFTLREGKTVAIGKILKVKPLQTSLKK